ncbi:50S ribosomal protein L27 [Orchesella cincta]|uniref:50S ribosomal protein L27 n=1 Tax=Orchesella cincta TaxID=48709 RepID=A0A1D2N7K3_ORCCI|nr:50S ribosomal protein L27 [Orchesella cincta]
MVSLWNSSVCRSLLDLTSGRGLSSVLNGNAVRFASKKASGGKRNPKQSPGNYKGIKSHDGKYVFPGEPLVYRQNKMWFHPGLNVTLTRRRMTLVALKEGMVRVTCEKPDLNLDHAYMKMWYGGRQPPIYKKYFHVIPKPQHTRFTCIDQI